MGSRRTTAAIAAAFCSLLAAMATAPVRADTPTYWQHAPDSPGDWFEPSNWTDGVPQMAGYGAYINNGGTAQISSGAAGGFDSLCLGQESGQEGTLQLFENGELSASNEWVGNSGVGRLEQSGGSNRVQGALYLGYEDTGYGTYELSGTGELACASAFIGYDGTGQFAQSAGTNTCANGLYIGGRNDWPVVGDGLYELSGTGQLSAGMEAVGDRGTGRFIQTGGINNAGLGVRVGVGRDGDGTYELSGTGQLFAQLAESIGNTGSAKGKFIQSGGTNTITGAGPCAAIVIDGSYELSGGQLSTPNVVVGCLSAGGFVQTGGTNTVREWLYVGYDYSAGTYELAGTGELFAQNEYVGCKARGLFQQTGGSNTTGYLYISPKGRYVFTGGTFQITGSGLDLDGTLDFDGSEVTLEVGENSVVDLSGGTVRNASAASVQLGAGSLIIVAPTFSPYTEFASFTTGGAVQVPGVGFVVPPGGSYSATGVIEDAVDCQGTITTPAGQSVDLRGGLDVHDGGVIVAEGSLSTDDLGVRPGGTLQVPSSGRVTVSSRLCFEEGSTLAAQPGAAIHLTGSAFENQSTDPHALAGLSDLALIFEGGAQQTEPLEVAGLDLGPVADGFLENFALGILQLGGVDVAHVQLVDQVDNQPGWEGSEALYVLNLQIGPSSYLDLNGLKLYYLDGTIDPTATVVGGSLRLVPEPATATLAALATILLLLYTWRRSR